MLLEDALRLSKINQAFSPSADGYVIGNDRFDMSSLLFEPKPPNGRRRLLGHWVDIKPTSEYANVLNLTDFEPLRPYSPLEILAREGIQAWDDDGKRADSE